MLPVSHHHSSYASLQIKPSTPVLTRQNEEPARARAQSDPRHGQNGVNRVSGPYHYQECVISSKNGSDVSLRSLPLRLKPKLIKNVSGAVPFSIDGMIDFSTAQQVSIHMTPTRRRHLSSTTEVDENAKEPACEADSETAIFKRDSNDEVVLKRKVDVIFSKIPSADLKAMNRLKEQVYKKLLEKKVNSAELDSILQKIQKTDDRIALVMGSLSSIGFIAGMYAWLFSAPTLEATLPPWVVPYLPGAITAVVDRMSSWTLSRIHPGYYCASPDPEQLTEVIRECLIRHQRPLLTEMSRQSGALSIPYTFRNVVITLCTTVAAHFGQQELVKKLVNNLGGFIAGGWVQHLRNENDRWDGLNDPVYFLGRMDLGEQLDRVRTPQGASFGSLANLAFKGIQQLPGTIFDALRHTLELPSMAEFFFLAGGFAGADRVDNAVVQSFPDSSPEALEFARGAASAAYLLALYASLVDVMTLADCLRQWIANIQPCPEAAATPQPPGLEPSENSLQH